LACDVAATRHTSQYKGFDARDGLEEEERGGVEKGDDDEEATLTPIEGDNEGDDHDAAACRLVISF
jgi:hypothetical protein